MFRWLGVICKKNTSSGVFFWPNRRFLLKKSFYKYSLLNNVAKAKKFPAHRKFSVPRTRNPRASARRASPKISGYSSMTPANFFFSLASRRTYFRFRRCSFARQEAHHADSMKSRPKLAIFVRPKRRPPTSSSCTGVCRWRARAANKRDFISNSRAEPLARVLAHRRDLIIFNAIKVMQASRARATGLFRPRASHFTYERTREKVHVMRDVEVLLSWLIRAPSGKWTKRDSRWRKHHFYADFIEIKLQL